MSSYGQNSAGIAFATSGGMTNWTTSLASGAVGALTLTAIHEGVRRRLTNAPRMDLVAMRGLRRIAPALREPNLRTTELHRLALAGDLVSNSIYYAAVPAPTAGATWARAIALGVAAGAGALLLPEPAGLGAPPHSDTRANQIMTIAWYLAGGLAAAAAATLMRRNGRMASA